MTPRKYQVIEARGHDGTEWKRMRVIEVETDTFDAVLVGFMSKVHVGVGASGAVKALAARGTFSVADCGVTWRIPPEWVVSKFDRMDAVDCALAALDLPPAFGGFFRSRT